MYIRSLSLIDTILDRPIRKPIVFHRGANFVVDLTEEEKHNKVGKTTFLKLIDVALGAREKDGIYIDKEMNSREESLENFILEHKIAVELSVSTDFSKEAPVINLRVDLFPRGRQYINNEKYSKKDYNAFLNRLFFDNNGKPSFRSLIKAFVRISMSGDNNGFLKMEHPTTSNTQYREIYNYLFDIKTSNEVVLYQEWGKELQEQTTALKQQKERAGFGSVEAGVQIVNVLKQKRESAQKELNDIVSAAEFEKNRALLNSSRKKYTELASELASLEYKFETNRRRLDELNADSILDVKSGLIRQFFDEIQEILPTVQKSFDELLEFNLHLKNNKKLYLENLQKKINMEITNIKQKQSALIDGNETLVALVANNRIDEYNDLVDNIAQFNQEISSREQVLKTFEILQTNVDELKEKLKNLAELKVDSNYSDRIDTFNKYFFDYAKKINGEQPVLYYEPKLDKFPLNITQLEGSSTGTRKSLISAYDFAYQSFAKEINKTIPNFVVHDVVESIEGNNLKNIIKLAEETDTQYIVALLNEKVDSAGITEEEQEKYQIVSLSMKDRLFHGESIL